jgi:hypothetical protein
VRLWDVGTGDCLWVHQTRGYARDINFNLDAAQLLIDGDVVSLPLRTEVIHAKPKSPHIGIGMQQEWLIRSSQRILWLPPEYRPSAVGVNGNVIAIGTGAGRVIFMRVDSFALDSWLEKATR